MKVTVIPPVISALGTVTKGLIKGLEDLEIKGRVETIQTKALLISARIMRRLEETCSHSNFNEKPSADTGMKNSLKSKMKIIVFTKIYGFRHSYPILIIFQKRSS